MCYLQFPLDFHPWFLRLHLGCGYWRYPRKKMTFQTNSTLHFPAAAWDVLNTLLTLHMAHVQQFQSRKYQTEMWESLLFGIQKLAGSWCPRGLAGSGCFHPSEPNRDVPDRLWAQQGNFIPFSPTVPYNHCHPLISAVSMLSRFRSSNKIFAFNLPIFGQCRQL